MRGTTKTKKSKKEERKKERMAPYSSMTVAALKKLAADRSVDVPSRIRKKELIALLEEKDEADKPVLGSSSSQSAPGPTIESHETEQPRIEAARSSGPCSAFQPENFSQAGTFVGNQADPKKGQNVSGRSWKNRPQKRASTMVTKVRLNNRTLSTWEKKEEEKNRRKVSLRWLGGAVVSSFLGFVR